MNTVRLNITLPSSVNDDVTRYAEELSEKKSHIISTALNMYFDYLDIQVAEKRLKDTDDSIISMNDFFEELDVDVQH